ncbi:MAG: hypothetical protein JWN51_3625 [Phycisphaerales bacterium]|nr:hypothetical protein [Phycisphaerales bacterium]
MTQSLYCEPSDSDDGIALENPLPAGVAVRRRSRCAPVVSGGMTVAVCTEATRQTGMMARLRKVWLRAEKIFVFGPVAHKRACIRADERGEATYAIRLGRTDATGVISPRVAGLGARGLFGHAAHGLCRVLELLSQHTRTKAGTVIASHSAIVPPGRRFSHEEACLVSRMAFHSGARTVVIDMKYATDATTSAFARLVLLRRILRAAGRDLKLVNLRARAANLYEINKLDEVLPRA